MKVLDMKLSSITPYEKNPIVKGGTNDINNLQPLCKSCNSSKKDKTMKEFIEYVKLKGIS